jgi:hypothetical protein
MKFADRRKKAVRDLDKGFKIQVKRTVKHGRSELGKLRAKPADAPEIAA